MFRSVKTVSKVWGFRLTINVNQSHLVSTWGPHPLWEIPCPAVAGIAQSDQDDPSSTGAKARLPVPPSPQCLPCPPVPQVVKSRTQTVTKRRCVVHTKRMEHASMEINASSPMAIKNYAQFLATQNTRQIYAAPIIVWDSVHMAQDVILFMLLMRFVMLQLSLQITRSRQEDPSNSFQCLEEMVEILGLSTMTTTSQIWDLQWLNWINILTCPATVHFWIHPMIHLEAAHFALMRSPFLLPPLLENHSVPRLTMTQAT